jgi:predicted RNase H-like HicB family nuclease
MFSDYIAAAVERAEYEMIDDTEPYYSHDPELPGVWAAGRTFEECRRELISTIEGWIVLRPRMRQAIPTLDGHTIDASVDPVPVGRVNSFQCRDVSISGGWTIRDLVAHSSFGHEFVTIGAIHVKLPKVHRGQEIGAARRPAINMTSTNYSHDEIHSCPRTAGRGWLYSPVPRTPRSY